MIKDVHDQRVLLQTVAQPHKLTVTPPDAGNLLPKTHAICLESRAGEKPYSQYKANIIPNVKRHECFKPVDYSFPQRHFVTG